MVNFVRIVMILLLGFVGILFVSHFTKRCVDNNSSQITVSEKIDTTISEQTFTAEEVNKLIAVSIDSVDSFYKNNPVVKSKIKYEKVNIDSLYAEAKKYWEEKLNTADLGAQIYETSIDTIFTAKDTSGRVTDSIRVNSSYYSRLPPDPNSFMSLNLVHKNFDYTKTITIKETITNESFYHSGFTIAAGYGMINNKFDVIVGYGFNIKFDFLKLIGGVF